jgi:hypothetical protein
MQSMSRPLVTPPARLVLMLVAIAVFAGLVFWLSPALAVGK